MKQVHIEGFAVSGSSVRTNNAAEAGPAGKIAALWQRFHALHPRLDTPVYGVYSRYESDASGDFTLTAGTRTDDIAGASVVIEPGTYLEFPCHGAMPDAIIDAWKRVWAHFSQAQPYARAYASDFEEYRGPDTAVIHIGIQPIR